MNFKLIIVCGMPRSGTSWLGQILDSCPESTYRLEPLFSYRYKNSINIHSPINEVLKFFNDVYQTNDEFILQNKSREEGLYPIFKKLENKRFMVVKTTRHHELLKKYLNYIPDINVISIVRHPCAVINSWIKSYPEFAKKGCKVERDWYTGECRKGDVGEYWGFHDWLDITKMHVKLSQQYSNFHLVHYSNLVNNPSSIIKNLFYKIHMPYEKQTEDFLISSQSKHHSNIYSVFKEKSVENKWKKELASDIAQKIIYDTQKESLKQFL